MRDSAGIYIHFPFCKRKCFYCHFTKFTYEKELVDKYLNYLVKEIHLRSNLNYKIDTIYLGGGSPSLLNEEQLSMIISAIYRYFNIENKAEITIEANPEDLTYKKLNYIKKNGVNRLSIGIQSFVKKDLVYLKRNHSVKQSIKAVENALNAGFSNINLDFIIGLPAQTQKTLEYNFSKLKGFDISHVSAYILEGIKKDKYSEERDNELYFFTKDLLEFIGYTHYEVSNFSKKGFQSKHNLKYWQDKNYIGIGLSASSYENRIDHKNFSNFKDYFKKIENKKIPYNESKTIEHDKRRIITGLRMIDGISIENFKNYKNALNFLISNNLLVKKKSKVAVNPYKILVLNEILTFFL